MKLLQKNLTNANTFAVADHPGAATHFIDNNGKLKEIDDLDWDMVDEDILVGNVPPNREKPYIRPNMNFGGEDQYIETQLYDYTGQGETPNVSQNKQKPYIAPTMNFGEKKDDKVLGNVTSGSAEKLYIRPTMNFGEKDKDGKNNDSVGNTGKQKPYVRPEMQF